MHNLFNGLYERILTTIYLIGSIHMSGFERKAVLGPISLEVFLTRISHVGDF